MKPDTIVIIGNGFDLNQGLKTSYSDFMKSEQFQELIAQKNDLSEYLKDKFESTSPNWIDIENELTEYSRQHHNTKRDIEKFKEEFKELHKALRLYLSKINYDELPKKTAKSYEMLKALKEHNLLIYDFNYTDTTKIILRDIGLNDKQINNVLIKVHGSIAEDYIIFGVEDNSGIEVKKYAFLPKAGDDKFRSKYPNLAESKNIHIFGHSLGKTDNMYFGAFFQLFYQNKPVTNEAKKWEINLYRLPGNDDLRDQLTVLVNGNMAILKRDAEVKFIDVGSPMTGTGED